MSWWLKSFMARKENSPSLTTKCTHHLLKVLLLLNYTGNLSIIDPLWRRPTKVTVNKLMIAAENQVDTNFNGSTGVQYWTCSKCSWQEGQVPKSIDVPHHWRGL
mmetsp:Transcript_30160/g.41490  ORF Transcript_30160/g.41490 Transcript_30160/m.41490 type:complete len:104 (+) Transcript_30160:107-418(+)